jgi:hypothetical protein
MAISYQFLYYLDGNLIETIIFARLLINWCRKLLYCNIEASKQ